jgi:predicted methyltransferase
MFTSRISAFFTALALALPGGAVAATDTARLDAVLAAQPPAVQARYPARRPAETLAFFEVAPGTTVIEAFPGDGWYTRILSAYLGPEGRLVGADYALDMYPRFGFFTLGQVQARESWISEWVDGAAAWQGPDDALLSAFTFGGLPEALQGTVDTVLFIRALHNLARFEADGGYLGVALQDAWSALKPGGVVGVVQHLAREDMPDDWADGSNGYLKETYVMERFTAAGFEFVERSEINFNENDRPAAGDRVWRLPPTLATSRGNPELREAMEAIGESHRMTLKFRKPDTEEAP